MASVQHKTESYATLRPRNEGMDIEAVESERAARCLPLMLQHFRG